MPVKHLARTTLLLAALASVVEGCSLGFGDDLSGEGTPSDGRGGKSGASGSSGRAGAAGTSGGKAGSASGSAGAASTGGKAGASGASGVGGSSAGDGGVAGTAGAGNGGSASAGTGGTSAGGGGAQAGAGGGAGGSAAGKGGAGQGGSTTAGTGGASAGTGGSQAGNGGTTSAGNGGTGGATAGTGGASAGTGGTSAGNGGTSAGTGGTSAGTGGASAGTGGASAGTGGTTAGSGGSGGKPADVCLTKDDCKTEQLCSQIVKVNDQTQLACFPRNPDMGVTKSGGVCDQNNDCESFQCLVNGVQPPPTKGVCSATCAGNLDCDAGASCVPITLSTSSKVRLCFPRCTVDADCDPGTTFTCALHSDPVSDTVGYSCRPISGGADFGEVPSPTTGCKWRFSVGSGTAAKCSHGCASDTDCAAPLPSCKSTTFTTPSGGTGVLKACVP